MRPNEPITELLDAAYRDDDDARHKIVSLIYNELRQMAQGVMAGESPAHTLQATAIVHEAYLRLFGKGKQEWANRKHFFSAAGNVLRQICVDHARKRDALKRGGQRQRVSSDGLSIAGFNMEPAEVLGIHEALDDLEKIQPRAASVVLNRYFSGLSVEETAVALEVSTRTVVNDWRFARAWLRDKLFDDERLDDNKS